VFFHMTGLITTQNQFSFQIGELSAKLAENLQLNQVGNWRFQFDRLAQREPSFYWYVGIANGRLIHSGSVPWSSVALLRIVQRYSRHLRQEEFQSRLKIFKELSQQGALSPSDLIEQLKQDKMLTDRQLHQFLQTKILSDFDQYLQFSSGKADFITDSQLAKLPSFTGFNISEIAQQAKARQDQWSIIKRYVPSLEFIPALSVVSETSPSQDFITVQQAKVADLVKTGGNINQISQRLAKDHIDVAQMFANLVQAGVITLANPQSMGIPTVLVIDDSSLMLTQFKHWLKPTKYHVLTCQDATHAFAMIKKHRPDVIFIDINMPVISGFDLVKQIRSSPPIANIPITIVTGEQKLSNQWRAKWSSCEFITKPLTTTEQSAFADVLHKLITRLLSDSVITPTQI
jgi:CheY-like chemotaxis protein